MSHCGRRTSGMHRISHFQTQSVARASVHFLQTRVAVKITRRIRPFSDHKESRRANYCCVEKFPARRIRPFSSQWGVTGRLSKDQLKIRKTWRSKMPAWQCYFKISLSHHCCPARHWWILFDTASVAPAQDRLKTEEHATPQNNHEHQVCRIIEPGKMSGICLQDNPA